MFRYQYRRGLDILRSHNTAKYRDMTIPVSIPCNRSIVDNCTLHDSNENKTSHLNHFCKLVICLQFAHALISVLSKRCISSSLWRFVNFRDLNTVQLMGEQCARRVRYRPTLAASGEVLFALSITRCSRV